MEGEAGTPKAWAELIKALTTLAKHPSNDLSPFHCEHDRLTVMADPSRFTMEELERLDALGFFANEGEGTFTSFRFGSA